MLNGSFLRRIAGGGAGKEPKSAQEAFPLAHAALEAWSPVRAASDARLCCVYTSPEESNRELQWDGRSRGWHFDFYLPGARVFYLARVMDGKVKGWERACAQHPVEYIYALYGSNDATRCYAEPAMLPQDWADSTAMAAAARAALHREMVGTDPGILQDYHVMAIVYMASYLRYLHPQWEPRLLRQPAPAAPCSAAIVSHIDADCHDSLLVYAHAVTGVEAACERFRFPAYMIPGVSADW